MTADKSVPEPFVRFEGDVVADLKTPPCSLATAKFSSASAEEVLVLGTLGIRKTHFDFCVGGLAVENISVLTRFFSPYVA